MKKIVLYFRILVDVFKGMGKRTADFLSAVKTMLIYLSTLNASA